MEEVAVLWNKFQLTRDSEFKNLLVEAYLPLVRQIATSIIRKLRSGVELDDLVSDGVFGLIRAIEQFDHLRGVKFETYATPVVRGSIYNGLRSLDWIPERTRRKARALQQVMDKFVVSEGRQATDEELASELKITSKELYDLIADLGCIYVLSLEQPFPLFSEDDEISIIETVEDKESQPEVEMEFAEERRILREAIHGLNEREQLLILKHYFHGISFECIAEELRVSKQRVSQMHTRAIRRLRDALGSQFISSEAILDFSMDMAPDSGFGIAPPQFPHGIQRMA